MRRLSSPSRESAISNKLVLYGRQYCHLCEDMLAALEAMRGELGFEVDVVDVDSDPALEERYGLLVPLLEHDGREICHYHLDAAKVREVLDGFR